MKLLTSKTRKIIKSLLFSFLLSAFMVCLVTGIATFRAWGMPAMIAAPISFVNAWIGNYVSSWLVAFPCLLVVSPLVKGIVDRIIK